MQVVVLFLTVEHLSYFREVHKGGKCSQTVCVCVRVHVCVCGVTALFASCPQDQLDPERQSYSLPDGSLIQVRQ